MYVIMFSIYPLYLLLLQNYISIKKFLAQFKICLIEEDLK